MEGGADRARGPGGVGRWHLLRHEDLRQEEGGGPRCPPRMRGDSSLEPPSFSCARATVVPCIFSSVAGRGSRAQPSRQVHRGSTADSPSDRAAAHTTRPARLRPARPSAPAAASAIPAAASIPARWRGLALEDLGPAKRVEAGRRHGTQPRLPLPGRLVPVLLPRDEVGLPRPRLPRLQPAGACGVRVGTPWVCWPASAGPIKPFFRTHSPPSWQRFWARTRRGMIRVSARRPLLVSAVHARRAAQGPTLPAPHHWPCAASAAAPMPPTPPHPRHPPHRT